jgi:hypothetical protein
MTSTADRGRSFAEVRSGHYPRLRTLDEHISDSEHPLACCLRHVGVFATKDDLPALADNHQRQFRHL